MYVMLKTHDAFVVTVTSRNIILMDMSASRKLSPSLVDYQTLGAKKAHVLFNWHSTVII